MDAHAHGSLVVSAGTDRSIRCFDAALGSCFAAQAMPERVHGVALHPVKPTVLVALHNSLKLFDVLWCASSRAPA